MSLLHVKITFLEEVLGTASADPEIHANFIAANAPDAKTRKEEIESLGVDAATEKSMTVFPRKDGVPIFYDYQIRGFFKDSCSALSKCNAMPNPKKKKKDMKEIEETEEAEIPEEQYHSPNLTAFKKTIDGNIFVHPRCIKIHLSGNIGNCQRPLRASTRQGERIALANSETVPAGSFCFFTVHCLNRSHEVYVREWLKYGELRGMGQWRNSGKGIFTFEEISELPK